MHILIIYTVFKSFVEKNVNTRLSIISILKPLLLKPGLANSLLKQNGKLEENFKTRAFFSLSPFFTQINKRQTHSARYTHIRRDNFLITKNLNTATLTLLQLLTWILHFQLSHFTLYCYTQQQTLTTQRLRLLLLPLSDSLPHHQLLYKATIQAAASASCYNVQLFHDYYDYDSLSYDLMGLLLCCRNYLLGLPLATPCWIDEEMMARCHCQNQQKDGIDVGAYENTFCQIVVVVAVRGPIHIDMSSCQAVASSWR